MNRSSVIIPVFNQAALTQRCLRALGKGDFEVIVVDDASTDETPQVLSSLEDGVRVVRHSVNQGFATSCNHGAAVASGEFLVFLNNDTVPRTGWLEALIHYADAHPEAAVIGSKLVYPDNTIQHAGVVICQDRYPRHIYTGFPAEHPAVNKPRRFQIVTAASMLARRSAFGQIGGFDPVFRNGFEDVDFCLRLREAGHQIHYCPKSTVEHLESVSPGRFKHAGANVASYRERWFGRVVPDDINYYLEDGLMQFAYEGSFPISVRISPRLAVLEEAERKYQSERQLIEAARQIAQLRRENTRLLLQLTATVPDSEEARYERLKRQLQELVELEIPKGATILVVSKGDRSLLEFDRRQAWHFPQSENGVYAGHHPGDSEEAIRHLEALRSRGAQYLLIPATSLWWLDYYEQFRRHLESYYIRVPAPEELCALYELNRLEEKIGAAHWHGRRSATTPQESLSEEVAAEVEGGNM